MEQCSTKVSASKPDGVPLSPHLTFYSPFSLPFFPSSQISPIRYIGADTAQLTLSPEHRLLMWLEQLPNVEPGLTLTARDFFSAFYCHTPWNTVDNVSRFFILIFASFSLVRTLNFVFLTHKQTNRT